MELSCSTWTRLFVGAVAVGDAEQVEGSFKFVSQFKQYVKAKWSASLQHADELALHVYPDDSMDYDRMLGASVELTGYLTSQNRPIVVVAPAQPLPGELACSSPNACRFVALVAS